jgi:hypothetical protein
MLFQIRLKIDSSVDMMTDAIFRIVKEISCLRIVRFAA